MPGTWANASVAGGGGAALYTGQAVRYTVRAMIRSMLKRVNKFAKTPGGAPREFAC
jgi:hypothetical protein